MANLVKVAAVLDAFADYYEQNEREKTSAIADARAARIQKIAATHLATHGEEMPEIARAKLAKTDDASLDYVEELLNKQAGTVTPLGAGAESDPETTPRTVKEAASAADDRFLGWILGS